MALTETRPKRASEGQPDALPTMVDNGLGRVSRRTLAALDPYAMFPEVREEKEEIRRALGFSGSRC